MKKIRKSAFKREESIEKLLDGLSLLHPTQMGKFLKGLDKVNWNKYDCNLQIDLFLCFLIVQKM